MFYDGNGIVDNMLVEMQLLKHVIVSHTKLGEVADVAIVLLHVSRWLFW